VKEEGWWLVVSNETEEEVLALKRLSFGSQSNVRLVFPEAAAAVSTDDRCIVLHLISDSYVGLDQRHTVRWGSPAK
jgi:hypothetical protein